MEIAELPITPAAALSRPQHTLRLRSESGSFTYSVRTTTTARQLLTELSCMRARMTICSLILLQGGDPVPDDTMLRPGVEYTVEERVRAGADLDFAAVAFVDVNTPGTHIIPQQHGDSWRVIGKGLNCRSKCVHEGCPAFGRTIYVNKGCGTSMLSW